MIDWRFTIVDRNDQSTVIDEPTGWADIEIKIKRDENLHGIFFDFQTNNFEFTGVAYDMISEEYDQYGVEGKMSLIVEYLCNTKYQVYYKGVFLFTRMEKSCGNDCSLVISIEGSASELSLTNRMDQKVDIASLKAFDGTTDLEPYSKLPFEITLPSKMIRGRSEGKNNDEHVLDIQQGWDVDWDFGPTNTGTLQGSIAPIFDNVGAKDFEGFAPQSIFDFINADHTTPRQEPDPLYTNSQSTETLECISDSVGVNFRMKGNFKNLAVGSGQITCLLQFRKSTGSFYDPLVATTVAYWNCLKPGYTGQFTGVTLTSPFNADFDFSYNDSIALEPNEKLFLVFTLKVFKATDFNEHLQLTINKESFIRLTVDSLCEPTNSKAFMINEVASRVIESITNNQLKLYSEYYGRTDSQPYSFPENGCGALKCILNGLFIRSAKLTDGTDPKIFISLKDILDALSCIDNIGMGLEGSKVRIENWKWFYKNNIVHYCDGVGDLKTKVNETDHIAIFNFGYDKWEAEQYNGLDEFLTKRSFRTQLTQVKNILEKICKWLTSGYAYEVTRRQGPNSKDWRYDNDVFALCLSNKVSMHAVFQASNNNIKPSQRNVIFKRGQLIKISNTTNNNGTYTIARVSFFPVYRIILEENLVDEDAPSATFEGTPVQYFVEQGNLSDAKNIADPPTIINFRISPLRNALKWFDWIIASYKKVLPGNKLIFTSGDGNYLAEGNMTADNCKLEAGVIKENQDIDSTVFDDPENALPLFDLETVSFQYPLSVNDFITIYNDPYGLIKYDCGGLPNAGWIKELTHRPNDGLATFTLTPKRNWVE